MAPPNAARSLAALNVVQALNGPALDQLVTSEVGPEMLGVMKAVAKAQFPQDDDATLARRVQLLLFGYLLHAEAVKAP